MQAKSKGEKPMMQGIYLASYKMKNSMMSKSRGAAFCVFERERGGHCAKKKGKKK
jgi:hypothetical protein